MTEQLATTTVLLNLRVKSLGNRQKVDASAIETDADRSMLYVSKALWDSEELKAVRRVNNEVKSWVRARSRPSYFRGGLYLVKALYAQEIDQYLDEMEPALKDTVEVFIEAMPRLEHEAKERLGSMYSADDYPTPGQVRQSFGWTHSWLAVDVPGTLKAINAEFYAKADAKAKADAEYAVARIRETLRAETLATVNYLLAALEPGENGKAKGFRAPVVKKVQQALDLMKYRDTDDPVLSAELDRVRDLVAGITDVKAVRDEASFAKALTDGFAEVRGRLAALVVDRPARRIDLTGEAVTAGASA